MKEGIREVVLADKDLVLHIAQEEFDKKFEEFLHTWDLRPSELIDICMNTMDKWQMDKYYEVYKLKRRDMNDRKTRAAYNCEEYGVYKEKRK